MVVAREAVHHAFRWCKEVKHSESGLPPRELRNGRIADEDRSRWKLYQESGMPVAPMPSVLVEAKLLHGKGGVFREAPNNEVQVVGLVLVVGVDGNDGISP